MSKPRYSKYYIVYLDNEIKVPFEGSMYETIYVVIVFVRFLLVFFLNIQAKTADIGCENTVKHV